MEDQAELIRQQMTEKRAELAEKLETLEHKVAGVLGGAQESVTETVETVKENVQETVAEVKHALDLTAYVREHPWLAIGGAVLVGYLTHEFIARGGLKHLGAFSEELQNLEQFAARSAMEFVGSRVRNAVPGEFGATLGRVAEYVTSTLTAANNGAPRGGA